MINWDGTTLATTMIWTAGELKYDGENERERGVGRGGELKQLKLFQNHSLQDFRYWVLIAICVKLHATAPKIQVDMIRVSKFKMRKNWARKA